MNSILVPLDDSHERSLRASYFAVEFAKRTASKVLLLTIENGPGAGAPRSSAVGGRGERGEEIDRLVNDSLMAGVPIETYVTGGDYLERVIDFAQRHNVSRVVVALPKRGSAAFAEFEQRIIALRERLSCVLVTVRSREDQDRTWLETG
jgi:hypothetical protein